MRDPYSILGLKKTATQDEIKAAWRAAAKTVHPDQNPDDPQAVNRFTEIGRAYDILKDPARRRQFDKAAEAQASRQTGSTIMEQRERAEEEARRKAQREAEEAEQQARATAEDIVSRIFGSRRAREAGRNDRRANGTTGTFRDHFEPDQSGQDEPASGWSPARDLFAFLVKTIVGGQTQPDKAPDLWVNHWIPVEDLFALRHQTIPLDDGRSVGTDLIPGTTDGSIIRIEGQGHRLTGLRRGDLIVQIRVRPHPWLRVEGHNLVTFHPVDIENAVLGCETTVESLSGHHRITVPEWSGSDQIVLVEGEGLKREDGTRGDLIVELRVMLWDFPDQKVMDLMRSLREGLFL